MRMTKLDGGSSFWCPNCGRLYTENGFTEPRFLLVMRYWKVMIRNRLEMQAAREEVNETECQA